MSDSADPGCSTQARQRQALRLRNHFRGLVLMLNRQEWIRLQSSISCREGTDGCGLMLRHALLIPNNFRHSQDWYYWVSCLAASSQCAKSGPFFIFFFALFPQHHETFVFKLFEPGTA